jgi:hypothetical protein
MQKRASAGERISQIYARDALQHPGLPVENNGGYVSGQRHPAAHSRVPARDEPHSCRYKCASAPRSDNALFRRDDVSRHSYRQRGHGCATPPRR